MIAGSIGSALCIEELAGILRKTTGLADVLREALSPLAEAIHLAFIFGSVAQGKERATSDVDVLIVGSVYFHAVVGALGSTRDQLHREVNPIVMTPSRFKEKYDIQDRFVSRVLREPKFFLIGDEGEFRKLVADRTA